MVGRFLAGDESAVNRGVDVQESEYRLLELGSRKLLRHLAFS
jgi:hypothetical protein